MSIYDVIRNDRGNQADMRPLAAFMVGREQKRARERQEQIDTLDEEFKRKQLSQADERIDIAREANKPKPPALDADVSEFMQVTRTSFDDPDFGKKFVAFKQSLKGAPPSTTINLPSTEREADKEYGKGVGSRATDRVNQSQLAMTNNANLDRMLLALDRGANTGFGEETILNLKSLGNTILGIDFSEGDQESEVLRKIGNELALQLRNPSSGLGLTGSTSNKDLDFLVASVPNLQKTEGGNLRMIEYAKRVNKLKVDTAAEQARIIRENGGRIPGDLDSRVTEFVNEYEIFTDEERAELEQISIDRSPLISRPFELTEEDSVMLDNILSR